MTTNGKGQTGTAGPPQSRPNGFTDLGSVGGPHRPDALLSSPRLEGTFWHRDLRCGLRLHASAVRSLQASETEAFLGPGLVCILALEPESLLDATIDGRDVSFAPLPGREPRPEGLLLSLTRTAQIRRRSARGQRICMISVLLPALWLDAMGPGEAGPVAAFRRSHLSLRRWQPSPRLAEAARSVLAPSVGTGPLQRAVSAEILALSLADAALRSLLVPSAETLSARECSEAAQLRAIVEAHLNKPLSLAALARHAGLSARHADAVFRRAYGTSVTSYVRGRRLDKAREGIERSSMPITQISFLAGYSSPTNFATAFRRRFGVTPTQLRRG